MSYGSYRVDVLRVLRNPVDAVIQPRPDPDLLS
jgi:hypothetical protein